MIETKSLLFDTQTVKRLLLQYYKKYFNDKNIKIKYDIIKEDSYSYEKVVITITKYIKIGHYDAKSENVLSNEDVITVLNDELENYGYKIKGSNFIINNTEWDGINTILEKINVKKKVLEN